MTGIYKYRSPRPYSLNRTCHKLARLLVFSISRISRECNIKANALASIAAHRRL